MNFCLSVIIKVGKRYTIVIPREIRKRIKIKEGTRLLVRIVDGKIVLEPLPEDPFKILDELIREPYNEKIDEKRAEEWLLRNASR